jgi:hypothetical protein
MNRLNQNYIGIDHYPHSYNSNSENGEKGYRDMLSTNVKYYVQAWTGYNDQICLTLKDRKVVSTGVTQEMIRKFNQGELPNEQVQLINNFVKAAIGDALFDKLSPNNLKTVSQLLSEPGENIEKIKRIVASSLFNEKLSLLSKYPAYLELASEHLDKLANAGDVQLDFLKGYIQELKIIDPGVLGKIIAHKDANQIIQLLSLTPLLLQNTSRLNEILREYDPVGYLEWMVSAYYS